MKVYLDNCCFNRPYDDQSQIVISLEAQAKLTIQKQIVSGDLEMVTSYMLLAENSANPSASKRDSIKRVPYTPDAIISLQQINGF